MKPAVAGFDWAFVGVCFSNFKLKSSALKFHVSPFERVLDGFCGFRLPCFCWFRFHITNSVLCLS